MRQHQSADLPPILEPLPEAGVVARLVGLQFARTYIACVGEDYPARVAFAPFADQARRSALSVCVLTAER
jgi:hypothetical protein